MSNGIKNGIRGEREQDAAELSELPGGATSHVPRNRRNSARPAHQQMALSSKAKGIGTNIVFQTIHKYSINPKGETSMKLLPTLMIAVFVGLLFVSGNTLAQEKETSSHGQMMQMMQDSSAMKMMMKHIATDENMRRMMMQEMMAAVQNDSTGMKQMCRMMMENSDMHSSMMKMMDGKKKGCMSKDGKMKHEMEEKEDHHEKKKDDDHHMHQH